MVKMFEVVFIGDENNRFFKGVKGRKYLARKTKKNGIAVKDNGIWKPVDIWNYTIQPFYSLFKIEREFYVENYGEAIEYELGLPSFLEMKIPDSMKSPYGERNEIYRQICNWMNKAGEDFIDHFEGNFPAPSFMFWAVGKGWITKEKFNAWEIAYTSNIFEADCANYYICGEEKYSVADHDNWEKAYMALAHFISDSVIYQKRLDNFLSDHEENESDK